MRSETDPILTSAALSLVDPPFETSVLDAAEVGPPMDLTAGDPGTQSSLLEEASRGMCFFFAKESDFLR
jgi:hypothetical protein